MISIRSVGRHGAPGRLAPQALPAVTAKSLTGHRWQSRPLSPPSAWQVVPADGFVSIRVVTIGQKWSEVCGIIWIRLLVPSEAFSSSYWGRVTGHHEKELLEYDHEREDGEYE